MDRETLLTEITALKNNAIKAGFDWPVNEPETATTEELYDFYYEVLDFLNQK